MREPTYNKFIPGVYNYCDRWCERCPLTNKCLLYAKDHKRMLEHRVKGENPYDWKIVMQDVGASFKEAIQILYKVAKEQGIDLEAIQEVAPQDEEYEQPDPSTHPLYKRAHNYMQLASEFLKKLRESIQAEGVELSERIEVMHSSDLSSISDVGTLKEIVSCYETISWYHTLVPAKIYRALTHRFEKYDDEEMAQIGQYDADGSAKVAYDGLVKSISALQKVYKWDEELKDSILTLLVGADRLLKGIDTEFPGHREFKRPGFNE